MEVAKNISCNGRKKKKVIWYTRRK